MPSKKGEVLWSRNGDDSDCDDTELIKMWDESMEAFKQEMMAKKAGNAVRSEWKVGDYCRARYRLDGQWYEAEVIKQLPQKRVVVEYIGYNDHEEVDSCLLRASKGQACRELQKEECLLAEYEDEEDSVSGDDEQSENPEEYLVFTKEGLDKNDRRNEKGTLEKLGEAAGPKEDCLAKLFQSIDLQNKVTKPKENKGTDPYKQLEQKEEAEMSALRKQSIQKRKLKGVGRSGGEPYSIPEGNTLAFRNALHSHVTSEQHNELKNGREFPDYERPEDTARSQPHSYSELSDYRRPEETTREQRSYSKRSDYGRSRDTARSEQRFYSERSDYGRLEDTAAARNEPHPYSETYGKPEDTARNEPHPYGNGHSDYRRPIPYPTQNYATSNNHHAPPAGASYGDWNSNLLNRIPPPKIRPSFGIQPPSSYLPPHPSYGSFRHRGFFDMMPPPPAAGFPGAPFQVPHAPASLLDDTDGLTSLLNSWYINGYNTGYYMGLRNARQDSQRHSSRNHT